MSEAPGGSSFEITRPRFLEPTGRDRSCSQGASGARSHSGERSSGSACGVASALRRSRTHGRIEPVSRAELAFVVKSSPRV